MPTIINSHGIYKLNKCFIVPVSFTNKSYTLFFKAEKRVWGRRKINDRLIWAGSSKIKV